MTTAAIKEPRFDLEYDIYSERARASLTDDHISKNIRTRRKDRHDKQSSEA